MKKLVVALALISSVVWVPYATARDANRDALHREWVAITAQQAKRAAAAAPDTQCRLYVSSRITSAPGVFRAESR
ncbi:MAG TPA: hypothetical protein VK463_02210 [Desulfomonilaceae bacterium]|nr:hypothetical protein [Desulfomonilaceae bacterium]